MATSRPFAYNTGSTISGTVQVGNLAVGTPTAGFEATGLKWWNGPDELLGYVIAVPISGNTQPTPISGVTALLGFYRTKTFLESNFIGLAQFVSSKFNTPQTFTSGNDASTWLTNNGYWNSWVFITPTPTPTNTITPTITPTNTITPTKTPTPTPTPIIPYSYKRSITIDYTKCGTANSTDFPVLVSFTDATFKTVANGGNVQNSNGYDIAFYSDSGLTTSLFWEIELYVPTTGQCIFWVKVPTLSSSVNTVIYIAYGKSGITTFQSTATSVWDSNFKGVWHLPNGTTLTTLDSTINANNGSIVSGVSATTGQIDGGMSGNGSTTKVNVTNTINPGTQVSVSAWVKTTISAREDIIIKLAGASVGYGLILSSGLSSLWVGDNTRGYLSGTIAVNDGAWHFIEGTFDGTTARMYVDGNLDTSSGRTASMTSTATSSIGYCLACGNVNYFNGTIDEIRVSGIARSASWVKAEYNNQNSPSTFFTLGPQT